MRLFAHTVSETVKSWLSRDWPPVSVKLHLTASSGSADVSVALVCGLLGTPTREDTWVLNSKDTMQNNTVLYVIFKNNPFPSKTNATSTLMTSTCSSVDLTGSWIRAVLSLAGCTSANARPIGWKDERAEKLTLLHDHGWRCVIHFQTSKANENMNYITALCSHHWTSWSRFVINIANMSLEVHKWTAARSLKH